MAEHIRVDFDLLNEAQRRIGELDDRLSKVAIVWATALDPFIDGDAWEGKARIPYNLKNTALVYAHTALSDALHEAAGQLGEIARIMREAEAEAGQG